MIFTVNERCHILQGITKHDRPLDRSALLALLPTESTDSQTHPYSGPSISPTSPLDPLIAALIDNYHFLFSTPTTLPPNRPIDHRIPLLPNTYPINVRPYRYANSQKEELDR